ncbi:guanylate cyclase [Nostocales cyanobacterium LEGE 12452]|nr:guanylate cyclase [Nostocales cyanobacterium LEGE 12452]
MNLFPTYVDEINQILTRSPQQKSADISLRSGTRNLAESRSLNNSDGIPIYQLGDGAQTLLSFDRQKMERLFGKNNSTFTKISIGEHPDFSHLKHNEACHHYCVSMFVDIKGSTRLATKYPLLDVRRIKDTVLTLCIHVANFFGGHIHRLQGDAIFVQFVGKTLHPNDAIINALNASSVLCQFISVDLSEAFVQNGLDPIKIRVGIDYGKSEDVLWSNYGIPGCSELTTTSLHTDLAAKLQAQAAINEIRIGKNVKDALDLPDEYWKGVTFLDSNNELVKDEYIFDYNGTRYRKYIFNWRRYLLSYDFISTSPSSTNLIVDEKNLRIICKATNPGGESFIYNQNSSALRKGAELEYTLVENGRQYFKKNFEKISWKIENRGQEAKVANFLESEKMSDKSTTNYPVFETSAAYLGHHFLKCYLERSHSANEVLKFPIYVL